MDAGNHHTFHKYTSVQFVIFYSMVYSQYIRPKATYTAEVKCTYVLAYSCTMIHTAVYVTYVQWSPLCIYSGHHAWMGLKDYMHVYILHDLCDSLLPYVLCVCVRIYINTCYMISLWRLSTHTLLLHKITH